MTAFASLGEILNRGTGGNSGTPRHLPFYKVQPGTTAKAGRLISLWGMDGYPGFGSNPAGSAAYPDNTQAGGMLQADPGGGRQLWLMDMDAGNRTGGITFLYDRLATFGGLSGTTTSPQTVNLNAITRYTDGAGNFIACIIDTQIGATARTITASYTDQSGNSGSTTQAIAFGGTGDREANRMIVLPLATGDTGVRAVASVTISASTGTAGAFGVIIGHWLHRVGGTLPGVGNSPTALLPGGPVEIKTDACLAFAQQIGTTTDSSIELFGMLHMLER